MSSHVEALYMEDSSNTEFDKQCIYSTLVNPMDNNTDSTISASEHLKPYHDAVYVAKHEVSARRTFQVLPLSRQLRHLLRHDSQRVLWKSHPHRGQI